MAVSAAVQAAGKILLAEQFPRLVKPANVRDGRHGNGLVGLTCGSAWAALAFWLTGRSALPG